VYFNTFFVLESQKSSDDNECMVDPEMVRLQFEMGSQRVWWLRQVIRAFGSYLVARHSFVQQVKIVYLILYYLIRKHQKNYIIIYYKNVLKITLHYLSLFINHHK